MSLIEEAGTRPKRYDFALYINGIYVPATTANFSIAGGEIISSFSLPAAKELRLLGYNDRLHFAFFIKDPVKGEYVLFTEGEIIGYDELVISSGAYITLKGRSFRNSYNIPVASVIGDPQQASNSLTTLLDPTRASIVAPPMMVLFCGLMAPILAQQNTNLSNAINNSLKTITSPFEYVQSFFSLVATTGYLLRKTNPNKTTNIPYVQEISFLESIENPSSIILSVEEYRQLERLRESGQPQQPEPLDDNLDEASVTAFKSLIGSYYFRFLNRYLYSKNIVKKIIPDPSLCADVNRDKVAEALGITKSEAAKTEESQEKKFHEFLLKLDVEQKITHYKMLYEPYLSTMATYLGITSNWKAIKTDGGMADVIRGLTSLFDVVDIAMPLPPLVMLKRVNRTVSEDKFSQLQYSGNVIYSDDGVPFIGNIIFRTSNIFPVIPRSNYITSNVIESRNISISYVGRVTRLYSNFQLPNATTDQLTNLLSLRAPYPPVLRKLLLRGEMDKVDVPAANYDLSMLISREEAFRGPTTAIIQPHPLHLFAVINSQKNPEGPTDIKQLGDYYLYKEPEGEETEQETLILLDRYVLYQYIIHRSSEASCQIQMPFNPYLIPMYPVVFADKRTNMSFVGVIDSITHSITANSSSTTITISNVIPIEEYLEKVSEAAEEHHPHFRTPAPYYIPGVDWLTQTYYGGAFYYGALFYRNKMSLDNVVILEDVFNFSSGEKISFDINPATKHTKFYEAIHPDKNTIKDNPIDISKNAEGFGDYQDYLQYVYRPGVTILEYMALHNHIANYKFTTIDGDKYDAIFDIPCNPVDNVNESEYSLTYIKTNALLISYRNKILSKTPDNFMGPEEEVL